MVNWLPNVCMVALQIEHNSQNVPEPLSFGAWPQTPLGQLSVLPSGVAYFRNVKTGPTCKYN